MSRASGYWSWYDFSFVSISLLDFSFPTSIFYRWQTNLSKYITSSFSYRRSSHSFRPSRCWFLTEMFSRDRLSCLVRNPLLLLLDWETCLRLQRMTEGESQDIRCSFLTSWIPSVRVGTTLFNDERHCVTSSADKNSKVKGWKETFLSFAQCNGISSLNIKQWLRLLFAVGDWSNQTLVSEVQQLRSILFRCF